MRFSNVRQEDVEAILEQMEDMDMTDWEESDKLHVRVNKVDPNRINPGLKYY